MNWEKPTERFGYNFVEPEKILKNYDIFGEEDTYFVMTKKIGTIFKDQSFRG